MLTKANKILLGLLVAQVALAILIFMRSDGAGPLADKPLLAGFDAGAVTKLQIYGDGKAKPIELVKRGTDWVLASHYDYPADPAKVEAALSPIAKLAAAEPIATSATRHKQLRVGDAEFERKLVVTAGGTDTTIFLGGPSGLRRNAVRIAGSEDVYAAAGISAGTYGAQPRDWVKGAYYQQTSRDIAKVTIKKGEHTVEVEREAPPAAGSGSAAPPAEETFKLSIDGAPVTLAAGETLDKFAITTIFSDVAQIDASPADPKREVATPTATITIQRAGATDVLDVIEVEGISYWVKQRGVERATTVDKDRLKSVIEAGRATLVTKSTPPPKPGEGSAMPPLPDGIVMPPP